MFWFPFEVAEAANEPQFMIEGLLVDRCAQTADREVVVDPHGPSVALLAESVTHLPKTSVELHPYFLALSREPATMTRESGTGGFELRVESAPANGGIALKVAFERTDADGRVFASYEQNQWTSEGSLLALPVVPAATSECPDGEAWLYVTARAVSGSDEMEVDMLEDRADVSRHFDGLGSNERRRRATALLAVSPATEVLVARSGR